jgi:hypothetical protein
MASFEFLEGRHECMEERLPSDWRERWHPAGAHRPPYGSIQFLAGEAIVTASKFFSAPGLRELQSRNGLLELVVCPFPGDNHTG